MITFDPRTISSSVYTTLKDLKKRTQDETTQKEQKNQAIELYTYLATWGLMRLKAEEKALSQEGKKEVVKKYFQCLEDLSKIEGISASNGLDKLKPIDEKNNGLTADAYLGLTGLGLQLAQEFAFWANAIYYDVNGDT